MSPFVVYIVLFVVFLCVVGVSYWAYVVYTNFKKCETGESVYCPLMYCDVTSTQCGKLPFKTNTDGSVTCASYLLTNNAPKLGAAPGSGGGGA